MTLSLAKKRHTITITEIVMVKKNKLYATATLSAPFLTYLALPVVGTVNAKLIKKFNNFRF